MLRACGVVDGKTPSTPDLTSPPLEFCEKILHTNKWCGQLAGWGAGPEQQKRCDALPDVLHRPSSGELFTCTYDTNKGCRKETVDPDLLKFAQACLPNSMAPAPP